MLRAWTIFGVVAVVLIALQLAHNARLKRSLEPLSVNVDLSRTGQYSFDVSGFRSSDYQPEIWLQLPFTLEDELRYRDDEYTEIWHGPAPRVRIVIRDREGRVLLDETGDLTRHGGWFAVGVNRVKLSNTWFEPGLSRSCRVSLEVLRGNEKARNYQPELKIGMRGSHPVPPGSVELMLLILGLVVVALLLLTVQILRMRRGR